MKDLTKIENLYSKLFSVKWEGKELWEHIKARGEGEEGESGELTAVPCMVGNCYDSQEFKIMIVGRAVNGWRGAIGDCSKKNKAVLSVLNQKNRLYVFGEVFSEDKDGTKYYYKRSSFLRMMYQLVERFSGSEENWHQRIAWSNLFKISPRNGGNPKWRMVRENINLYCDIIKEEIKQNRPDLVVFVTGLNFFDPYPNRKTYSSFRVLIDKEVSPEKLPNFICCAGSFVDDPDIKLVVCDRPERRLVAEIVNNIESVYKELLN